MKKNATDIENTENTETENTEETENIENAEDAGNTENTEDAEWQNRLMADVDEFYMSGHLAVRMQRLSVNYIKVMWQTLSRAEIHGLMWYPVM